MIRMFPKSRHFLLRGIVVTILLVILFSVLLHDVPLAVLSAVIGLSVSWLGSQYVAISSHQKLLEILYKQMDPDTFLEAYTPLLEKCKPGSKLEAAVRAQIGNGYSAKGAFEKALTFFTSENCHISVRLMQAQNRCSCYLNMEDIPHAQEELDKLDALIAESPQKLQSYARTSCRMFSIHLNHLKGIEQPEDTVWLREESATTNKPLHRSTTRLLLAKIYRMQGKDEISTNMLRSIADESGKTWITPHVRSLLASAK